MLIREVVTKHFFRKWAFVIYPIIKYPRIPTLKLRKHEWAHVAQVRQKMHDEGNVKGWLMFYINYAAEAWILRLPHDERTIEIEANRISELPFYMPWIEEYKNCPEKDRFRNVKIRNA